MRNLIFFDGECVEIKTREQYNEICHLLRNTTPMAKQLDEPIFLEHAHSVRGSSIGYILEPKGTWSKKPLTIKSFEQATSEYGST